MNFAKIYEEADGTGGVLSNAAVFYDFVDTELHNQEHITIQSEELDRGNHSHFDYMEEGDDGTKIDSAGVEVRKNINEGYIWKDCKIEARSDALYWTSASGKKGCVQIFAIVQAELKPEHIKLWIAPTSNSTDSAIITFTKMDRFTEWRHPDDPLAVAALKANGFKRSKKVQGHGFGDYPWYDLHGLQVNINGDHLIMKQIEGEGRWSGIVNSEEKVKHFNTAVERVRNGFNYFK
jgi:hypothetical protein